MLTNQHIMRHLNVLEVAIGPEINDIHSPIFHHDFAVALSDSGARRTVPQTVENYRLGIFQDMVHIPHHTSTLIRAKPYI